MWETVSKLKVCDNFAVRFPFDLYVREHRISTFVSSCIRASLLSGGNLIAYPLPIGGKVAETLEATLRSILRNPDSVRFSGNTFSGITSDFVRFLFCHAPLPVPPTHKFKDRHILASR